MVRGCLDAVLTCAPGLKLTLWTRPGMLRGSRDWIRAEFLHQLPSDQVVEPLHHLGAREAGAGVAGLLQSPAASGAGVRQSVTSGR